MRLMRWGVGEAPEAVEDLVFVGDFEVGGAGWFVRAAVAVKDEAFRGEGGVGVEHVDLFAVGAGGFEEGEAVRFVLGEGLLVAVDDLVGVVVEVAEGNEAFSFTDFGCSGDGVGLGVAVEGGLGFLAEDALFAPGGEGFGGAGVHVMRSRALSRLLVLSRGEWGEGVGVIRFFFCPG